MLQPLPDLNKQRARSMRGIASIDVASAADALLRAGVRPTINKVREKIGRGSPNTINPLLDDWWKALSERLDSGPAALHRLPEPVVQVAEALWMQALDEGRRRAHHELHRDEGALTEQQRAFEFRSHVLALRESELDSRLKDRERTIDVLGLQLRELNLALRKERATRESIARRLTTLEDQLATQINKRLKSSLAKGPARPRGGKPKRSAPGVRNNQPRKLAKKRGQAKAKKR